MMAGHDIGYFEYTISTIILQYLEIVAAQEQDGSTRTR